MKTKKVSVIAMPMRIQARKGSVAEQRYYAKSALPSGAWPKPKAIAPGIDPSPLDDLIYHGGKVIPQMEFQNIFLGSSSNWKQSDIDNIDSAIGRAMRDRRLNNVMAQYFPGAKMSCDQRQLLLLNDPKPARMGEPEVQAKITSLFDQGKIKGTGLDSTLFNLVLPPGTILALDDSTSQNGLGGYHGSLHIRRGGKNITLYYSANVFSDIGPGNKANGIVVFDQPWKNVVGTLCH